MCRVAKPGDVINGYKILEEINRGNWANAYAAQSPKGRKVFFKQYKSPKPSVEWYRGYVNYQAEMKKRLSSPMLRPFCCEVVDFFEFAFGPLTYFQVFEFVEKGHDLQRTLDDLRKNPASVSWKQRLLFAKVILSCVAALHANKIVHGDLKPPNVQLYEDPSIDAGYQPKMIDMDFSLLADITAPWHGREGYVGTPLYSSPEHNQLPLPASDVFTCGLILYELLGKDGHPYWLDEVDQYLDAARKYKARPPRLAGPIDAPANAQDVVDVIHRCLDPNPSHRPTAKDVRMVLNGQTTVAAIWDRDRPAPPKPPERVPDSRPVKINTDVAPAPKVPSGQLTLTGPSGNTLTLRTRTQLGKNGCRMFGDESQFLADQQYIVERRATGEWWIVPNPAAPNETLLNGRAITAPAALHDGDAVAVGRESRGVVKLPLKVHLV